MRTLASKVSDFVFTVATCVFVWLISWAVLIALVLSVKDWIMEYEELLRFVGTYFPEFGYFFICFFAALMFLINFGIVRSLLLEKKEFLPFEITGHIIAMTIILNAIIKHPYVITFFLE